MNFTKENRLSDIRNKDSNVKYKEIDIEVIKESDFSVADYLELTSQALTEFTHRDNILWSQCFKLYIAVIFLMIIPNIAPYFQVDMQGLPSIFFRFVGIILSFFFLLTTLGYSKRLEAISKTHRKLLGYLPNKLAHYSLVDDKEILKKVDADLYAVYCKRILKKRLSNTMIWVLFFSLISVGIMFIILDSGIQ